MGNQNEDYLDQLLSSMGNAGQESKKEIAEEKVHTGNGVKPQMFQGKGTSGDSFLEEYDREMLKLDAEQLISEYEDSLGEELVGKKTIFGKNGLFGRKKKASNKDAHAETVNSVSSTTEEHTEEAVDVPKVEEAKPVERRANQTQELDELFAGLAEVMEGKMPSAPTNVEDKIAPEDDEETELIDEDEMSEDALVGSSLSEEDEALFNALTGNASDSDTTVAKTKGEDAFGFDFGDLFGEPSEEGSSDAADILEILGEMSGDEDLDDIGQMLKAQDAKEDISFEDIEKGLTEEQALTIIRNHDEEQPLDKEKRKAKWKFNKWNLEKKGFLQKLSLLLFGEDEEETKIHIRPVDGIEDTTGENDNLIKEIEKKNAAAEKKAKQEEKKKAREKQQEDKKKIKAAEKKAKDAQKKAKNAEKKAKAAKEVDKTPPLPKKPVFLIFLLAASIVVAVIFAGNGMHYNLCLRSANEAYSTKNYVEAYGYLRNTETKEEDYELLRKVSILASMQELLRSYTTLYEAGEYEMALDNLIRVIGRYEDNLEEAEELGILAQFSELEAEAEDILKTEYGVTYEQAMKLYSMTSRKKYSVELVQLLREVGLLR